ncbi:Protein of unknown function DUF4817 [Trinorchestia longiramus]|nr:Protein of unknown function DUF4817 [Trinorchestia longiramus]
MQLTNEQHIFINNVYAERKSLKEVQNEFEQRFPERSSPTKKTVWKTVNKFRTHGTISNLNKGISGRLKTVSWVRRRDYHLLTVGRHVYTSDDRVAVKVAPDASDWILTLRWVRDSDAGQYECQVSSHPPQALMVNLKVKEAWAEIKGESERYIHSGSSLRLVCVLRDITEPPSYVFWFREDRMINYDTEAGVSVKTLKGSSILSVSSVTKRDEGNYRCVASNTSPASVTVHVVQKENPAGLQQETVAEKDGLVPVKADPKTSPELTNLSFQRKKIKNSRKHADPVASSANRLHGPLQGFLDWIFNKNLNLIGRQTLAQIPVRRPSFKTEFNYGANSHFGTESSSSLAITRLSQVLFFAYIATRIFRSALAHHQDAPFNLPALADCKGNLDDSQEETRPEKEIPCVHAR